MNRRQVALLGITVVGGSLLAVAILIGIAIGIVNFVIANYEVDPHQASQGIFILSMALVLLGRILKDK